MNVVTSYVRTMRVVRGRDLPAFCSEHDALYRGARGDGDHFGVTRHYYSLMTGIIEGSYGEDWHFCPPRHGQSRREAVGALHAAMVEALALPAESAVVEVGCGIGGAVRDIARRGNLRVTGVTAGREEAARGRDLVAAARLGERCTIVEGDCQALPLADRAFDGAYAIYALKYFATLARVLGELHRVLRPGAPVVAYEMLRTERYDARDPAQRALMEGFEYATGMPPLRTAEAFRREADAAGFEWIDLRDLALERPWYHDFVANPVNAWLVTSRAVRRVVHGLDRARLLPHGFAAFNDTFLAGTVAALIRMGRMGILTGSALVALRRR